MNWFDIILIAVLVLSTVIGIWRGFISMIMPLIGIIIGVILAGLYAPTVGGWLSIDNAEHAKWAGYAIILVGTLIVSIIFAVILTKFVHLALLGWLNRLLGGIFGLASGALLCAAVLAACVKYGLGTDFIQGSGIAQLMLDWIPGILVLLPGDFDSVKEFFQQ
jgi:membrane protein required for colicin V production